MCCKVVKWIILARPRKGQIIQSVKQAFYELLATSSSQHVTISWHLSPSQWPKDKKKWSHSCNKTWRPVGLWYVEAPTFIQIFGSQMAVRLSALRVGRPLSWGRFLVLVSSRSWVDPSAIVRLEGLGQLKNQISSSRIEPATSRLVA
jgi:hypothetical protein